jgi:glutamate-1-semialdehyde 2,1-aminomutase
MRALRVARAYTGRPRIAKTDRGYHGSYDHAWYGPELAHVQHPGTLTLAPGLPASVGDEVVLLPFNDVEQTSDVVVHNVESLAAIIVEPVLGASARPASFEYLRLLRELATSFGIVSLFDEMISLGVAYGGVQAMCGVTPDMTTAGKTVAHGLPLAFYGGRADVVDVTGRGASREVPQVVHGGTYQRHNLAFAAASAALKAQDRAFFDDLANTGERLRDSIRNLAATSGWPLEVTGIGHLWNWQWIDADRTGEGGHFPVDPLLRPLIQTMLLNRGVYLGGMVSAAHTDEHLEVLISNLAETIDAVARAGLLEQFGFSKAR